MSALQPKIGGGLLYVTSPKEHAGSHYSDVDQDEQTCQQQIHRKAPAPRRGNQQDERGHVKERDLQQARDDKGFEIAVPAMDELLNSHILTPAVVGTFVSNRSSS